MLVFTGQCSLCSSLHLWVWSVHAAAAAVLQASFNQTHQQQQQRVWGFHARQRTATGRVLSHAAAAICEPLFK